MSALPVIIAGGGIAGLSAALAIARAGQPVTLFERDPARSEEGAGIQLSSNASRHLRTWGVLERLAPFALAPEAVVVRRGTDGAALSRLDLTDAELRYGAPFRIAHRADLHRALLTAAAEQPTVTLSTGVAVTGWRDGKALLVATSDGHTHDAAALVIADGVHSKLRPIFDRSEVAPLPSGRIAWRALIAAEALPDWATAPVYNLWLGPDAHLVHYPLRGGAVVNVVAVVAGAVARHQSNLWSRPGDPSDLAARFAGWHRDARDLLAAGTDWRLWPLLARPAPKVLVRGRVALVGDAAHPVMPFLAQGAAQAIEDGAALGAAFAATADPAAALRAFEAARLSRIKRIVAASERQAAIYHLRGLAARARDFAMQTGGSVAMRVATDWIYRG